MTAEPEVGIGVEAFKQRELFKYEEAMRKKDERRERLQAERNALLLVIEILSEELSMLRKSYEKDSRV